MTDYIVSSDNLHSVANAPMSYKSGSSEQTVSFGQKSNYQSELAQPMIGFKFNADASNGVISIVNDAQTHYIQKPMYTEIVQTTYQAVTNIPKNRPSSVTPTKRARRDVSPVNSRPTSAVRGRALHVRNVSVTNCPGMTDYINKRSQDRSAELKVKTVEENKKTHVKTKTAGKVVLDTANQRKHLERQVAALENRIKRLQQEDSSIGKKMETVDCKTERALANKKRHYEEIAVKEIRNKKREESIQRRKTEVLKEKQEQRMSVKKAVIGKLKDKYEHVQVLRKINEDKKEVSLKTRQQEEEKKKMFNKALNESLNMTRSTRVASEESAKKETSTRYIERANIEKERARELSIKCKELEKVENEMFVKVSMTKSLFSAKKNHLVNVSAAKPVIIESQEATQNKEVN